MKTIKAKNIKGSTMTEYVLMIGLIAAASIVSLSAVGANTATFFNKLAIKISAAGANL